MSNIKYTLIIEDILNLLKYNQNILLEEHYVEFLNTMSFLNQFEGVSSSESVNGCHFINCPWSSNQCKEGPDTCACYILENKLLRMKKLILLYKRLQNKQI